jgi:hypothetical protein
VHISEVVRLKAKGSKLKAQRGVHISEVVRLKAKGSKLQNFQGQVRLGKRQIVFVCFGFKL